MKNIIIIAFLFASCEKEVGINGLQNDRISSSVLKQNDLSAISIITIDRCEYIYAYRNGQIALCHKGDCRNPFHVIEQAKIFNP